MTSDNLASFRLNDPPVHLLTSNTPPSESEASEIRRIIRRGHAHATNLETQITRLREAIDALHREHADVQKKIAEHSAILSPLRRFPPEIIETIFRRTLHPVSSSYCSSFYSPWNISRVCGRWRSVSLASPDLWTQVNIYPTLPVEGLRAQLERSRPRPLSVYVAYNVLHITDLSGGDALGVILEHSARWETVYLLRPPRAMILRFNALSEPGCLPLLRTLIYKRSDDSETCTAFATAPQLTDVRIDGSHRRLEVPFGQLTRLRVQMPRTPDRLRMGRNLVQLTLGKASASLPPPSYADPIEFPRLRMLFVTDGHYLESFLLPALKDICIKENAQFLPGFIDRSACQLTKLTIIEPVAEIIPILDRVPSVIEMRFHHFLVLSDLVQCLATIQDDADRSPACAELRHLALCELDEAEFPLALQMLDDRRRSDLVPSISLCVLELTPDLGPDFAEGPYDFPAPYEDLRTEVEWLRGKRAQQRYESWRADYPGGGK